MPVNLADFPAATLARYGIEAHHPGAFLVSLLELDRIEVCTAARRVRVRVRQPPLDAAAYIAVLERCSLPSTAAGLHVLHTLL